MKGKGRKGRINEARCMYLLVHILKIPTRVAYLCKKGVKRCMIIYVVATNEGMKGKLTLLIEYSLEISLLRICDVSVYKPKDAFRHLVSF